MKSIDRRCKQMLESGRLNFLGQLGISIIRQLITPGIFDTPIRLVPSVSARNGNSNGDGDPAA